MKHSMSGMEREEAAALVPNNFMTWVSETVVPVYLFNARESKPCNISSAGYVY